MRFVHRHTKQQMSIAERVAMANERDCTIAALHVKAVLAVGAVEDDVPTIEAAIQAQAKWLKSLKQLVAEEMKEIIALKARCRALKAAQARDEDEDDEDDDEDDEDDDEDEEDEDDDEGDGPSGKRRRV